MVAAELLVPGMYF